MVSTLCNWRLALISAFLLGPLPAWSQNAPRPAAQQETAAAKANQAALMDAQLFYELLAGEMSAAQGDYQNAVALLMEAARNSQSPALYRRAVELALQSRSAQQALAVSKEWQYNHPQSREANRYLLQILVSLNRVAESEAPLIRELAWTPADAKPSAYLSIAQMYSRTTDKVLTAAVIQEALQSDLQVRALAAPAWATIGHTRLMAERKEMAMEAAQNAYNADPRHAATALLALELLEAGVPEAEALAQDYMGHDPQPTIQLAYVRVLMGLNRLEDAQQQLKGLLQDHPDMPDAWLAQATIYSQLKQWEQAQSALLKVEPLVEADNDSNTPLLAQSYLLGARIALQKKDYPQALDWLDKMPENFDVLNVQSLKALALAKQGKLAQGRALIRAIPARNPAQEKAKRQAEIALLRDADAPQEAYLLQRALFDQSPQDIDIAYETALLAERAGKVQVMEKILRDILVQQPDHQHARNALGYSLADRGIKLQEAHQLITEAFLQSPEDPFITDSLGWVEFRMGNLSKAAELLEKAFALRPDVEIAAHLGEVLWTLGNQTRARNIWQQGKAMDADNMTLQNTLKRLRVKL